MAVDGWALEVVLAVGGKIDHTLLRGLVAADISKDGRGWDWASGEHARRRRVVGVSRRATTAHRWVGLERPHGPVRQAGLRGQAMTKVDRYEEGQGTL